MDIKIENNTAQFDIEITKEKFQEGINQAFNNHKKEIVIPGFRKGKAPQNIVMKKLGEEIFYNEAMDIVFPPIYEEAVKQNDLFPVDKPTVDIKQIGKNTDVIIAITVTIKPEVILGQYFNMEIEKEKVEVTEEQINEKIQKDLEGNARIIPVEDRTTKNGDIVTIDFEGFVNGDPFEGGTGANYELTLGSGQFIPGFEEQLIDRNLDDNVNVNVTFPKDYHAEKLAGMPALFKVKIKLVQTKILPELDDEFAKDISEFETLEEYKKSIYDTLLEELQKKSDDKFKEDMLDKIITNATIDLPQIMIDNQLNNMMQNFDNKLRQQGLDLQTYIKLMNQNGNDFMSQYTARAEKEVRMQLVIEKIGKVENILASSEEFDNEVKDIVQSINKEETEFKNQLTKEDIDYINNSIIFNKTIQLLIDNNTAI